MPEYLAIRPYIGQDAAVEYFIHFPDPDKWIPADQKDQPIAKFIRSVHWEKIHAVGGAISFSGEATRAHGAILGDTSAGSLFDVAGSSATTFQTQPIVGAGPYFSISKFNFSALYQIVREAAVAAMTPQQSAGLLGAEAMAQGFLGMSVSDALQLFTGEFGSRISFAEDGESQQLYAAAIQKQPDVLRLLRAALAKFDCRGRHFGRHHLPGLVVIPIAIRKAASNADLFYYLAVTPQFIITGPRKAMVRDAVARMSGKTPRWPPQDSVPSDPEFVRLRHSYLKSFPDSVVRISGKSRGTKSLRASSSKWNSAKQSNQNNPPTADMLRLIKPGLINRHLKASANGWWKDSGGIYFDYYIQ